MARPYSWAELTEFSSPEKHARIGGKGYVEV